MLFANAPYFTALVASSLNVQGADQSTRDPIEKAKEATNDAIEAGKLAIIEARVQSGTLSQPSKKARTLPREP